MVMVMTLSITVMIVVTLSKGCSKLAVRLFGPEKSMLSRNLILSSSLYPVLTTTVFGLTFLSALVPAVVLLLVSSLVLQVVYDYLQQRLIVSLAC